MTILEKPEVLRFVSKKAQLKVRCVLVFYISLVFRLLDTFSTVFAIPAIFDLSWDLFKHLYGRVRLFGLP